MFGELLIPTARDSPPVPSSSQNPLGRYSFYFFCILGVRFSDCPLSSHPPSASARAEPLSSEPPRISFSRTAQHVLVPPACFSQRMLFVKNEQAKDRRELNPCNCGTQFLSHRSRLGGCRSTSAGEFLDGRIKTRLISILHGLLSSRLLEN